MASALVIVALLGVVAAAATVPFDSNQYNTLNAAYTAAQATAAASGLPADATAAAAALAALNDYAATVMCSCGSAADATAALTAISAVYPVSVQQASVVRLCEIIPRPTAWLNGWLTTNYGTLITSGNVIPSLAWEAINDGLSCVSDATCQTWVTSAFFIPWYVAVPNSVVEETRLAFSSKKACVDAFTLLFQNPPTSDPAQKYALSIASFQPVGLGPSYVSMVADVYSSNKTAAAAALTPVRTLLLSASMDTTLTSDQRTNAKAVLTNLFVVWDALGIPR